MKQLMSDPRRTSKANSQLVQTEGRVTTSLITVLLWSLKLALRVLLRPRNELTKKNVHPGKIVQPANKSKLWYRCRSFKASYLNGLKQCSANPWEDLTETYPIGTEIEGEIRNITEFGLFVGLTEDIDGLVHLSDISWETTARRRWRASTKVI